MDNLDEIHKILLERNSHIPKSFAISLDFLTKALNDISTEEEYQLIKDHMSEFILTIFDFHGRLAH